MTAHLTPLLKYVEGIVDDYANEVDPNEVKYPDCESLEGLVSELKMVVEGCVADWLIEVKERAT